MAGVWLSLDEKLDLSDLDSEAGCAKTLAEPSGQKAVTCRRHCQDDMRGAFSKRSIARRRLLHVPMLHWEDLGFVSMWTMQPFSRKQGFVNLHKVEP